MSGEAAKHATGYFISWIIERSEIVQEIK